MLNNNLDPFTKEQLLNVIRHLAQLGYTVDSADEPNKILAVNMRTVDINIAVFGGIITFDSLWASSEYAMQNYSKYLNWVNTLNLQANAVQFCVNQVGTLSMRLWYFGKYDPNAFEAFHHVWSNDIEKVWASEAREYFLT